MGLWSKLLRFWQGPEDSPPQTPPPANDSKTVALPPEPYVFECQSCGKVFEARRKRAQCPECDSTDVSLMSE